jgi:hypothetical protein
MGSPKGGESLSASIYLFGLRFELAAIKAGGMQT